MKCKKCNFDNYEGTNYCQSCGTQLTKKASLFSFENGKFLAGWGGKGLTTAPLIGMAVEGHSRAMRKENNHRTKVPVLPHENGNWYCPDCGQHNSKKNTFCKGCGRDI